MAAGGVLQLAGTGINLYRSDKFLKEAQSQLRDLENNPIEPYKASTQLNTAYAGARAGAAAPRGMSMEDVNRFMINQSRNENTALANANKMGGGRGNLAILNAGLSGMSSDLASKSAAIAQQNRLADASRAASLSGTYQSLSNMNVNANMQAQQAYGQAIRQQRQNIGNAWSSLANMGGMMAGYGMMKGSPAKTGVENTTGAGTTEGPGYDNIGLNYTKPNMYPALNKNYNFNSSSPEQGYDIPQEDNEYYGGMLGDRAVRFNNSSNKNLYGYGNYGFDFNQYGMMQSPGLY